ATRPAAPTSWRGAWPPTTMPRATWPRCSTVSRSATSPAPPARGRLRARAGPFSRTAPPGRSGNDPPPREDEGGGRRGGRPEGLPCPASGRVAGRKRNARAPRVRGAGGDRDTLGRSGAAEARGGRAEVEGGGLR